MAGFWIVLYKQQIDERKQQIIDEIVRNFVPTYPALTKPSLSDCTLVDELLRLESATLVDATPWYRRVICQEKRPVLCEKQNSKSYKQSSKPPAEPHDPLWQLRVRKRRGLRVARWLLIYMSFMPFFSIPDGECSTKNGNIKDEGELEEHPLGNLNLMQKK